MIHIRLYIFAHLENYHMVSQADLMAQSILAPFILTHNLTLLSPDKGTQQRTLQIAERLGKQDEVIFCQKTRDSQTSAMTQTIVNLAKLLNAKGAYKLYLYVTHGSFSKELEVLTPYFSHIYCAHIFYPKQRKTPTL